MPGLLIPNRLLTIAEYLALGETECGYTELQEGRVLLSPNQSIAHQVAVRDLTFSLADQLRDRAEPVWAVDIDLGLAASQAPGFSRRPDISVLLPGAVDRLPEGSMLQASEVLIAVEVVSPGSKRTDYVIKRGEYADAGIPHYWILDLDEPVSLVDCHLAEGFGYQDAGGVTGTFETTAPFPVRVELDKLF